MTHITESAAGRFETPREAKKRKALMAKRPPAQPGFEPHACQDQVTAEDMVDAVIAEARRLRKPTTKRGVIRRTLRPTNAELRKREKERTRKRRIYGDEIRRQSVRVATGAAVGLGTIGAVAVAAHYGKPRIKKWVTDVAGGPAKEVTGAAAKQFAKAGEQLADKSAGIYARAFQKEFLGKKGVGGTRIGKVLFARSGGGRRKPLPNIRLNLAPKRRSGYQKFFNPTAKDSPVMKALGLRKTEALIEAYLEGYSMEDILNEVTEEELAVIYIESLATDSPSEDLIDSYLDEARKKKKKKKKPMTASEKKKLYKKIATGAAVGLGTAGALALASYQGKKYLASYIKDVTNIASKEAAAKARAKLDKEVAKLMRKDKANTAREIRQAKTDLQHTGIGIASIFGAAQAARPMWGMIKSLTASADDMVAATLTENENVK